MATAMQCRWSRQLISGRPPQWGCCRAPLNPLIPRSQPQPGQSTERGSMQPVEHGAQSAIALQWFCDKLGVGDGFGVICYFILTYVCN